MKAINRYIPLILLAIVILASCGYHNPNIYTGPDRVIYLATWKNRTNELGLDARFYRSLVNWFQKSGSITITKDKAEAQLVLAGEVVSLQLPSLSYGSENTATEVKMTMVVRYVLKDLTTGAIVIEEPGEAWTENYLVEESSSVSRDNQRKAISTIVDDISERIYQKSLAKLNQQ